MFNKPINRWWTVVAGAMANAVGAGVVASYALGVFTKSISADFGWDRSFTTLGLSVFFLTSGLGSLLLGSLLAKWPLRSVTLVFIALFSLALMAVAALPPSIFVFCIVFGLMGVFGSAATALPYAIVITQQFDSNRGLALALMICGGGIGALLLPNYANLLLEWHGWRAGYFGIGLVVGIVSVAALVFFLRVPPRANASARPDGLSLKQIFLTSRSFWLIGPAIFATSIMIIGLVTNMVPILTDRGMTTARAASLVGLMGGASWIGRIGVGLLLDRLHARFVAAGIFLIATMGVVLLALSTDGVPLYLAAALLGIGIGAESDLVTFMVSRYFPAESLSRALGAVWICWAWGNGIGVFAASLSYDLTGNYNVAFMLFAALGLISSMLILRLGEYAVPVVKHGASALSSARSAAAPTS